MTKSDCRFDLRPDLLRSVKDDIDLRNGSDGSDSDDKGRFYCLIKNSRKFFVLEFKSL